MKRAERYYWKWWKSMNSWSFSLVDLQVLKREKKPHFFEQEILSITRKIWSKVGCPQWGRDSVTAPNKQKIPDLFPESVLVLKGAFFPGGIITLFIVVLVYLSSEKWNLPKTRSDVFRSSILVISCPENCLRTFAVGNPIDTNNTSSKYLGSNSKWIFLLKPTEKYSHCDFFFCFKPELTVEWPSLTSALAMLLFKYWYYILSNACSVRI